MSLQEISLVSLSSGFAIAAPSFLYFRKKMSKEKEPSKHSRNRIIRFTAYNLILNSLAYFGFMLVFLGIISKPGVTMNLPLVFASTCFLLASAITFYGCGIYITAVITETLTPQEFRKMPYFKRQFTVTNMFHGPISHTIIFSGFIVAGALLCILDLMTGPTIDSIPRLLLVGGGIMGLSMGYSQIINGSAPYHTVIGIVSVVGLYVLDRVEGWKFTSSPVGIFMIGFFVAFLLLNIYTIIFRWKGKNIWGRSGYREYN
jgi:hypothetical protein